MNDNTELLEAALKLADFHKRTIRGEAVDPVEQNATLESIEKFRPAPKLVETWVRVSPDERILGTFRSKKDAESCPFGVRAVHVREVTPPDESKRWEVRRNNGWSIIYQGEEAIATLRDGSTADFIVTAHNEAMGFGKEGGDE